MKVRTGFVSNSSSSSFVIPLSAITINQAQKILNHAMLGKEMLMGCCDYPWAVHIESGYLYGETDMDNFDMFFFINAIGINENFIKWNGDARYICRENCKECHMRFMCYTNGVIYG